MASRRWMRAGNARRAGWITASAKALGKLYMEKYFNERARERMGELVKNLEEVYHDHLAKEPWMSEATRKEAVAKVFEVPREDRRPEKFRDYSSVEVKRDDFLGNMERASAFESRREIARIGGKVDRTEWEMTAADGECLFPPNKNEIVFPAGILQRRFSTWMRMMR